MIDSFWGRADGRSDGSHCKPSLILPETSNPNPFCHCHSESSVGRRRNNIYIYVYTYICICTSINHQHWPRNEPGISNGNNLASPKAQSNWDTRGYPVKIYVAHTQCGKVWPDIDAPVYQYHHRNCVKNHGVC